MRGAAGTPLVEAFFPSALRSRRVLVCRLCQFATRCPASALSLVPARSSLDRGTVVVGERCPCGFRTLETVCKATRATQSIYRRRGFCARPEWRYFVVGHVMRLARDTHLAALSERDERTAGAHPDCGPCVRDSQRTVVHARVIHQGRLFARRTATRMSMDDARPDRSADEPGVTPRHAPRSSSRIGGAHGI